MTAVFGRFFNTFTRENAIPKLIPVYSDDILDEYIDVLSRAKFGQSKERISFCIEAVRTFGIKVAPAPADRIITDIDDLPFYEAALSQSGAYLITGNKKHFPDEPFIVTPREFLDITQK